MKYFAPAILTLAVLSLLAAIWAPGPWWSWLLTAVVLLFVGAGLAGPAHTDNEPAPTGNSTGPHIHITTEDVQQYKRQYGRKAGDQ